MSSEHPESFDASTPSAETAARQATAASASPSQMSWERQALSDLVQANLKEQQAARRWKMGLRLGWLLFWLSLIHI
jgi:protease-4